MSITYSECVFVALSYPACNAHAPRYIVIHGLSGSTVFFHSRKGYDFLKNFLKIIYFYFPFNFETFLIIRGIQRDTIINVHKSSCKVPVILIKF
jgi:hypothetical protein